MIYKQEEGKKEDDYEGVRIRLRMEMTNMVKKRSIILASELDIQVDFTWEDSVHEEGNNEDQNEKWGRE